MGEPVHSGRVVYLNFRQADSGRIGDQIVPDDYRDLCRFMHCGAIDRSGVLDPPFAWQVLDPIPTLDDVPLDRQNETDAFADLCDARGGAILEEAGERAIQVFWSGGIDSTTALIAVMRAAEARGRAGQVRVLLSIESVLEYPEFYLRVIDGRYAVRPVGQPMAGALDAAALNVTGEHGDQLFGSQLLAPYVQRGVAQERWRDLLPLAMLERLRDPRAARRAWRLAERVVASAPVPTVSLFDALWWLNFTLKWQDVRVRMLATRGGEAPRLYGVLRHFFQTDPFQRWALRHTPGRVVTHWADYKLPAKHYVRAFTGDERYFQHKVKEDSLRHVLGARNAPGPTRVFMREDLLPIVSLVDPPAGGRLSRLLHPPAVPRGSAYPEFGG